MCSRDVVLIKNGLGWSTSNTIIKKNGNMMLYSINSTSHSDASLTSQFSKYYNLHMLNFYAGDDILTKNDKLMF